MKTIGFAISHKENERRRAIIPSDLKEIRNVEQLYFQRGYGEVLGYCDDDYAEFGAKIADVETVYSQDIICNPKAPEPVERKFFSTGQTLFGWIHAVQGREITDFLLERKMTAIAWEKIYENSRYVFTRNREIAGEAGVLHAFLYYGKLPYECSVAVIGRGQTARGAVRVLEKMGAKLTVYDRVTSPFLRDELDKYDVVVNCVLWDVMRTDRLIYREDLKKMREEAMIIDISCDKELEIETSHPTSIDDPVYYVDGILHYCVDNTPSVFWKTATRSISEQIRKYIDDLIEERNNEVLKSATVIKDGVIQNPKILTFQNRASEYPHQILTR